MVILDLFQKNFGSVKLIVIAKYFLLLKIKTWMGRDISPRIFFKERSTLSIIFRGRVTVGDGSDGFLHTAATLIKTVTTVTNRHGLCEIQVCDRRDRGNFCKLFHTHLTVDLR